MGVRKIKLELFLVSPGLKAVQGGGLPSLHIRLVAKFFAANKRASGPPKAASEASKNAQNH